MGRYWKSSQGNGEIVMLGTAEIGSDEPTEPVPVDFENVSSYTMAGVVVGAQGKGAKMVQFAMDDGGQPGVWAEPGQQVIHEGRRAPGESFRVWTRIYPPEDGDVGTQPFEIFVKGMAVA